MPITRPSGADATSRNPSYSLLFSALSIVTLPMIVISIAFNRHIVEGITAGSVK